MESKKCLIGILINTSCGDHLFFKDEIDVKDLVSEDLKTLKYRIANFPNDPIGVICLLHINDTLRNYSLFQKSCFDPLKKHGVVKSSLKIVNFETCENFYSATTNIVPPGSKLCISCYKEIVDKIKTWKEEQLDSVDKKTNSVEKKKENDSQQSSTTNSSEEAADVPPPVSDGSLGYLTESQEKKENEKNLKRILDAVDLHMPKRQKLTSERKEQLSADLAGSVYDRALLCINETFETSVNIDGIKMLEKDSKSLNLVLENIINCYNKQTTHSEKIKILTLFRRSWSYKDIKHYVECTSYMVRKASIIREANGVLADPPRKKFTHFSEEFVDSIEQFYRGNSRPCSGAKKYVSVYNRKTKSKEKKQKLLLLASVRELYDKWIDANMNDFEKIPGFSFFASLRPKECKLPGDPGTHSVCVCAEHQNVKLKCRACNCSLEYRKLLDLGVCSVDNEFYMLYDCPNCPGPEAIRDFLNSENFIRPSGTISYCHWSSVSIGNKSNDETQNSSRVTLHEKTEVVNTFYDQFIADIWDLRKHHFVSECQKSYFDHAKNNLEPDTGLLIMDFAENYTFIAQDSAQAFYYNNKQATLHPFVLYYRDSRDELQHVSFCIISDYLKHNASVVNIFQEKVLEVIKERFPWIQKLIYFSDGAPTQYKNKNNFVNLCAHEKDFGIEVVSYNFFATSHGKGPCDGIGAFAKRVVREACIKLPPEQQILDPKSMFEFLEKNMVSTKFIYVCSKDCEKIEKKLKKRFDGAHTVENTRRYHFMRPIDDK